MKNKKAQLNNFGDWFKAVVTLIFGIILFTALKDIINPSLLSTFKSLGIFLIIIGIIIFIISLVPKRRY